MKTLLILSVFFSVKSFAQIKIQSGSPQNWVTKDEVSDSVANSQRNLGWVNVMDYGADSTGTLSNYAAFTAAQASLGNHYGVLYVPKGKYLFDTTFVIDKDVIIKGDGMGKFNGNYSATKIFANTNIDLWKITAAGTQIIDIGFEYTNATAATSARGLYVYETDTDTALHQPDTSEKFILRNVSIRAFYKNIYIEKGAYWLMDNVENINPVSIGLHIENTTIQDAGDWSISNSLFFQSVSTPGGTAVEQTGSGGGKIVNVKFNGSFAYDYNLNFNGSSSILLISNCSFEHFTAYAIYAINSNYVKVEGCEFATPSTITGTSFVYYSSNIGGVISNNVFNGAHNTSKYAFQIVGGNNSMACSNAFPSFTSLTPFQFSGGTSNFLCGTTTTGTTAPSTTPAIIGQWYIDTTNGKAYFSKGTSSSSDWIITN